MTLVSKATTYTLLDSVYANLLNGNGAGVTNIQPSSVTNAAGFWNWVIGYVNTATNGLGGGSLTLTNADAAIMAANTNQNFTAGANTLVNFNFAPYDNNSLGSYATNAFLIKKTGVYDVKFSANSYIAQYDYAQAQIVAVSPTGTRTFTAFTGNGTTYGLTISIAKTIALTNGEYLNFYLLFHGNNSTLYTNSDTAVSATIAQFAPNGVGSGGSGGSATNVNIGPGTGISITTNVVGGSYTINSTISTNGFVDARITNGLGNVSTSALSTTMAGNFIVTSNLSAGTISGNMSSISLSNTIENSSVLLTATNQGANISTNLNVAGNITANAFTNLNKSASIDSGGNGVFNQLKNGSSFNNYVQQYSVTTAGDIPVYQAGTGAILDSGISGSTPIFTSSTANYFQFTNAINGGTNATPPANTTTIRAWVNFTNVTGGTVFKLPLYQ